MPFSFVWERKPCSSPCWSWATLLSFPRTFERDQPMTVPSQLPIPPKSPPERRSEPAPATDKMPSASHSSLGVADWLIFLGIASLPLTSALLSVLKLLSVLDWPWWVVALPVGILLTPVVLMAIVAYWVESRKLLEANGIGPLFSCALTLAGMVGFFMITVPSWTGIVYPSWLVWGSMGLAGVLVVATGVQDFRRKSKKGSGEGE